MPFDIKSAVEVKEDLSSIKTSSFDISTAQELNPEPPKNKLATVSSFLRNIFKNSPIEKIDAMKYKIGKYAGIEEGDDEKTRENRYKKMFEESARSTKEFNEKYKIGDVLSGKVKVPEYQETQKDIEVKEGMGRRESDIINEGVVKQIEVPMTAAIAATGIAAPVATAISVGAFSVADHFFNARRWIEEKYPNADPNIKDAVEIVDFIAKGAIIGGGFSAMKRYSVKRIEKLNLPKAVSISPEQAIKLNGIPKVTEELGITKNHIDASVNSNIPISVPLDKVMNLAEKPSWQKIRQEILSGPEVVPLETSGGKITPSTTPERFAEIVSKTKVAQRLRKEELSIGKAEEGLKSRGFIETVKESPKTVAEVGKEISSKYSPITNKETLRQADELIAKDFNAAQSMVEGPDKATALSNAIAIRLIDKAQIEGRFVDAVKLVERTAEKQTELGQAIQSLSMYNRLSPEGILQLAERTIRQGGGKPLSETPSIAKDLRGMAEKIEGMPEGREKQIETALMLKKIVEQIPPTLGKKIAMVQTMAQLLNPKTMIRNILGNLTFQTTENIAQTLGSGLDIATSSLTGKRTVYAPDIIVQAKGIAQGLKEGTQEALLGIDLKNVATKFDLPKHGVFNKGVLGGFEKMLRVSLGAPDRAFYQSAFNDSLSKQMKLAGGIKEPTAEMIEKAHLSGLYRTFQDDNVISNQFVGLKKWLNNWTVNVPWLKGEFGVGDLVIKYPKTPANILARGIEYSPFGFINTVMRMSEPLSGNKFNQEAFVQATSRATTGTVLLMGTGAILASLGIITGKKSKDKDVNATREAVGIRQYQINIDALKRFAMSGLDPEQAKIQKGDTLISYDWMQPSAIGLALGANMLLEPKSNIVDRTLNFGDRLLQSSETLQEQPLVQGVKTLTSRGNITEGLSDVLKGIPASFVPTILNQIKQLNDNVVRNTSDPNYFKEAYNKTIQRIPIASKSLPAQINVTGEEKQMYQGGTNNPFNVFINPSFVNKYKPDPVSEMVLGIWERSGERIQFPRVAEKNVKFAGIKEMVELTAKQQMEYQKYIGNKTGVLFTILSGDEAFMSLPDEDKAKKLQKYLTDINSAAKIEVLGNKPKRVPSGVKRILENKEGKDSKYSDDEESP